MKIILLMYLSGLSTIACNAQQKEILLLGTMHTVPKIVKDSYKPLLRRAIKYNPEAIFVESPRPNDTLSWEYLKNGWSENYVEFYELSDSLRRFYKFDQNQFFKLLEKDFNQYSNKDYDVLINSFGYLRDNANYKLYSYLKKYGGKGTRKPTRHEDGDLTFKLAIAVGLKQLIPMDDQQTNQQYHDAWQKCATEGRTNGDNDINKKLNKKDYNSAVFPAIFRGLGMHVNKRSTLERLHNLASFTYVQNETQGCILADRFWNERNRRMAETIGNHVRQESARKNIVIVGAAHIISLEKELKKNFPEIKIKRIRE